MEMRKSIENNEMKTAKKKKHAEYSNTERLMGNEKTNKSNRK